MKILQILPELNAGGVERGTVEIARALVLAGHESVVVSNGGRLVAQLEADGTRHLTLPVHRKRIGSLLQISKLRRIFEQEKPDIVHARSRVPAWLAWLALRGMDVKNRPHFVTTVHGFYSVNVYSAVMTKGERVIAVSESIRGYILKNYPAVPPEKIRVIHRGVDPLEFARGWQPDASWLAAWTAEHPALTGKRVLLLPGRITRWKGQTDFIELIAQLNARGQPVHGLIAGDTHPKKKAFLSELQALAADKGVSADITFLGHRSDVREVMAVSDMVFSLSTDPEAFGRVSLEAMALGKPVVAYDHGGVAEQLKLLFPGGTVKPGDQAELVTATLRLLEAQERPAAVNAPLTLSAMCEATLAVYAEVLASR
jgi:glycosyltransferase involved in cell wall biosynthesis